MTLRRRGPQAAIPTPRIATDKNSTARANHRLPWFAPLSTIDNFSSMTITRSFLNSYVLTGPDYSQDMKIDLVEALVPEGHTWDWRYDLLRAERKPGNRTRRRVYGVDKCATGVFESCLESHRPEDDIHIDR